MDGVSDVRLSFSRRVCEVAMNDGVCGDDAGEGEWAEDDAEQYHQDGLLHGPQ
jgi:hypothetical protein